MGSISERRGGIACRAHCGRGRWNTLRVWLFAALSAVAALAQSEAAVPNDLKPPDDQHLVFRAHGTGEQIYICQPSSSGSNPFTWQLSGPEARLVDDAGKEIARHFAGPSWQASDGSLVKGKVIRQSAPDPGSIPWLLLTAVDHSGTGIMENIVSIQRLDTMGGKAPASGCDAQHQGAKTRVPYTADYYFYAPAK